MDHFTGAGGSHLHRWWHNRGAELRVDVNGTFIFCYRPMGEFSMDSADEHPARSRAEDDTLQPGVLR